MPQRLLLFGGSFNPIHNGHLAIARSVAEQIAAERIILIPCANPPHKSGRKLAPAADRLEMCRLAVAEDRRFEMDNWETRQSGPNYTLLTIKHYRESSPPDATIFWLIGMDSLRDLPTWYRIGELASLCTLVTAGRPGIEKPDLGELARLVQPTDLKRISDHILETPLVPISATDIRRLASAGATIADLVPAAVEKYIREKGLYNGPDSTS